MRAIILLGSFFLTYLSIYAQETVGGKVVKNTKDKTYQRGEQKGDETVDKALNKIEEGLGSIFKKKDKNKKKKSDAANDSEDTTVSEDASSSSQSSSTVSNSKSVKINSKFDFVPGEKIIGFDDFSTTDRGDFPNGWNTNSSGEISTLDDNPQKWLFITKDGYFQPDFVTDMPVNFTLEFDVFTRYRSSNILEYQFYILPSSNPRSDLSEEYLNDYFQFKWMACEGSSSFYIVENGETVGKNEGFMIKDLACEGDNKETPVFAKFSIWRQDSRLRIYVNENKVLDIPQAFEADQKYNVFKIGAKYMNFSEQEDKDEFMISNLRYAVGAPDTRNKLITEGKWVTHGILFAVNAAVIQPNSYGILKEIAGVLNDNPSVKIKIIGHTDSDGDANSNLTLSQNRAEAVKTILVNSYGIEASRLQTDGKGESVPLNQNATATEKANNRRVEFVKL